VVVVDVLCDSVVVCVAPFGVFTVVERDDLCSPEVVVAAYGVLFVVERLLVLCVFVTWVPSGVVVVVLCCVLAWWRAVVTGWPYWSRPLSVCSCVAVVVVVVLVVVCGCCA
jgi:hypothetical protein